MEKKFLKSGEFARRIGVSRTTLWNYEKRGILKAALITPTGYKLYTEDQVEEYFRKYGHRDDIDVVCTEEAM